MSSTIRCRTCGYLNTNLSSVCQDCGSYLVINQSTTNPFPSSSPAPMPPAQGYNPYAAPYPGQYQPYPPPMGYPPLPGQASVPSYGLPPPMPQAAPQYGYQPGFYSPYAPLPMFWRDGDKLVVHETATLPDRCLKCNQPADGKRVRQTFRWHSPVYYLLVLAGLLIYFVVALIVRQNATVEYGLCQRHFSQRRMFQISSWSLLALSVIGFIAAVGVGEGWLALFGLLALVAAAVFGTLSQFVTVDKIDKGYVWLKKIDLEYLRQFPYWGKLY